jgi:hypothetical protein
LQPRAGHFDPDQGFSGKDERGGTFALIANGQAGPNHPAAVGVLSF